MLRRVRPVRLVLVLLWASALWWWVWWVLRWRGYVVERGDVGVEWNGYGIRWIGTSRSGFCSAASVVYESGVMGMRSWREYIQVFSNY